MQAAVRLMLLAAPALLAAPVVLAVPAPASAAPFPTQAVPPTPVETTAAPAPGEEAHNPASGDAPSTEAPRTGGGDAFGEEPGGVQIGALSIRTLLQTRYIQTRADHSSNPWSEATSVGGTLRNSYAFRENVLATKDDGWGLNRFFLRFAANPTPMYGFKSILDVASLVDDKPDNVVKQAYATVNPIPKRLEFTAGIFKIPFSTMELDPIAEYELASLGHTDDFLKDQGFAGRDSGAQVGISPLSKRKLLRIYFGAFMGNAHDEHASPVGVISGRLELRPVKFLMIGVSAVDKPKSYSYERPFTTGSSSKIPAPAGAPPSSDTYNPWAKHQGAGKAYEADVSIKAGPLAFRGEVLMGDRVDLDTRYDAETWWATWWLVAYRFQVAGLDLMPAARIEFLDADRQHAGLGLRRMLSFGVNFIFSKDVRLLFDVAQTHVDPGSPLLDQPKPLGINSLDANTSENVGHPYNELSRLKGTVQLQVMM